MKVVHIFKDFYPPTTGGIEQHMSLLCRRLQKTISVTILVPSRSFRRVKEYIDGVRIVRVPEFGRYASAPLCPTAPLEIRRLRPDIVHLHFPNPMGDLTYLLGARNTPLVVTYHSDIIRQRLFLPFYKPVLRRLFGKARKIIASANENIDFSPWLKVYRHKCEVVAFGVDPQAFMPNRDEKREIAAVRDQFNEQIICFVGAARYYKGLDVLLKAMVAVKGHLFVIGRGTNDASLHRMVRELGIDARVTFCGEVSQSRLRLLMNASDIFVLPSIDRCETFGIVQLEAMACSKPVVSTDLPTGTRSVNRHEVTGLVVPPGEPDALADALNRLLANPRLRTELGNAARRQVEDEFSAGRMVSKTLEIYAEVLREGHKEGTVGYAEGS